jgi:hypothetical protein
MPWLMGVSMDGTLNRMYSEPQIYQKREDCTLLQTSSVRSTTYSASRSNNISGEFVGNSGDL